jgi:hypothetical protein
VAETVEETGADVVGDGGEGEREQIEFKEDPDVQIGSRLPVKMADPLLPKAEEINLHDLTHLPHRSWCSHCVRAKGKALEHRRGLREHQLPELHVDYCFMGTAAVDKTRAILVAKQPGTKYLMASVMPLKGASHEFPAKRLCAFLRELGLEHNDVVLKSDQEPAIGGLLNEVVKKRVPAKSFVEQSPVGASASNGVIERGNLTIEGQILILKDALEASGGEDPRRPPHRGLVGGVRGRARQPLRGGP